MPVYVFVCMHAYAQCASAVWVTSDLKSKQSTAIKTQRFLQYQQLFSSSSLACLFGSEIHGKHHALSIIFIIIVMTEWISFNFSINYFSINPKGSKQRDVQFVRAYREPTCWPRVPPHCGRLLPCVVMVMEREQATGSLCHWLNPGSVNSYQERRLPTLSDLGFSYFWSFASGF